jgi:hypothetical protein
MRKNTKAGIYPASVLIIKCNDDAYTLCREALSR